ncbi:DUF4258 domain-containing protein [Desulfobaculum sp. SPO524]|uniref:DUF4258 domain-containing protein n=1 Tax=Desulfobaculum sp. SPO524 TaxID=3378071 RepID=UPI003854727E
MLFTCSHARKRMSERGITRKQVENAVCYGTPHEQRGGRFRYDHGRLVVITDGAGLVITAWLEPKRSRQTSWGHRRRGGAGHGKPPRSRR